jgi:crotonobetainyl-CoA hydratase
LVSLSENQPASWIHICYHERMTQGAEEEPVLFDVHDFVLTITFNRPDVRNALDGRSTEMIGAALDEADADDRVRAIVKPLIAAVNGAARGGGTELVLACDLAVAGKGATLGLPETRIGRLPGAGGAFRLPAAVGMKRALEMLLVGEAINAQQALQWGLVNSVVPDEEVVAAATRLAQRIAANAPLSVRAVKRIAYGGVGGDRAVDAAGWADTVREIAMVKASRDAQEGATAFLEHRTPVWEGR